ncbi:hypothetical protein QYE76_045728 [Lolium multiflorum]|uniref:CCHC-type domain-containing protein n=1 Tax=Lolium multiflorum TaxID=4521 RepID=A0AAD8TLL3_LOLMU|nr:hypothetical protein QYE76_045728 [Lolium multiflorum]
MVRRIRFIYRKSLSKFGNDPVKLWNVLEGSRKVRKESPWKVESQRDSSHREEESQVDSTKGGRPPHQGKGGVPPQIMASPSINFNQFLEKEKLKSNGSNFTDWFRHCAILCSLEAELQKRFEHHDPCDMINELKVIFETHAAVESYEASKQFFGCMMEEGSSVSEHVFAMSGHAKKLSDLGIVIPNQLGIHRVLQSLPPSYKNFVMNYNMQNMNKELPELFSMLKSAEIEIKKEHQVLMVNKTTSFKKQGKPKKGNFKKGGKKAAAPPEKPKAGPKPDTECYYCNGKGHWKRNCPKYLADLKSGLVKKKKVWGCEAYVKKLQPDKLEPKAEKCVFIGYPKETIGYTFYHRSEGKIFVAKNGTFLEKEFLTKESSAVPEDVPVPPAPIREEANDNDHETSNEVATEPRRSTRERTTPDWYDPCLNVMIVDNNDEDPATYEEAMMSPDSNKWQEAMKSEMGSMYDNKVWTLVDLPDSRKAIENKWIFKRKTDADGNITVYKARLVAKGFRQIQGVDYDETFSPVAKLKSVRILLAIAAFFDYEIWQMDVKTAFLNGDIEEELYMVQPKGFVEPKNADKVCKLQRSIYGLKQASRSWNRRFDKVIKDFGFIQCHGEACIYKKVSGSSVAFLILYVDDILLIGNDIELLSSVKGYLNKCFSMKDLGEAAYILGIKIYRDRSRRLIGLSQSTYLDKILKKFRMDEISWCSSKQCTVAKSSTESEYIAASEASSEAVWMKRFIVELGVVPSALDPLVIYCDNMGAIANAQEPRSHKKLKHIKLRFHSIREYIEDGEVKICKVHTDLNVADPLTKALPRAKHDQHQNAMGVRVTAASAGRRTPERKELSGGQESGKFPPEGEIDAIAIVIERDIISIIIIIISTIYTVITTAAPRISMNEVRKKLFTISLSGKAAHWYKLLKNGDSIDWEDIVPLFYSKFYPPSEIHKDRNRIYNFWPHDGESIAQAWGRLKSLMLKCPIHELPGNVIIDNFYARLSFQDKTLLDTSCSGSFTRKNEEFKRDLLDRIQENTEGWENDKDRESGIIYDYKCIEAFMDTDKFRNMSATYGLDSQVVANLYKAFASHYELPKKNFDKYHEPYKDKIDSSVNKCVVIETVDNVIPEAYIEKTPFPAKMKEYSVISSAVNKSEKKPKEPEEQIKIEPAVAIVKDLVTENVEDGHIIFCEDASNIVSHPNKSKQVSVPMLSVRIGDHCYYGLCDIGASVSAIPYELYTEIMHEIGSCELEDIDVVIHLANRETISPIGIVRDVEVLCEHRRRVEESQGATRGWAARASPRPRPYEEATLSALLRRLFAYKSPFDLKTQYHLTKLQKDSRRRRHRETPIRGTESLSRHCRDGEVPRKPSPSTPPPPSCSVSSSPMDYGF